MRPESKIWQNTNNFWVLLCIHLLFLNIASAQHNNNWAFGLKSGITFNTVPPSLIQTAITNDINYPSYSLTSTSYSDCNGSLIVYGHDGQLWNKNNTPMLNGNFSSKPNTREASPIIPKPNSTRYLYFFYRKYSERPYSKKTFLYYSIIDMNLDNGLGGVLLKDRLLDSSDGNYGAIGNNFTYTHHRNKRDIWLIFASSSITAKSYLLTDTGISQSATVKSNVYSADRSEAGQGGPSYSSTYKSFDPFLGHFKFTHDGKNLIVTGIDSSTTKAGACLMYDFDNSNGQLSNYKILLTFSDIHPPFKTDYLLGNYYFCEISPNDSLLYFASFLNYEVNGKGHYRTVITQVSRFSGLKTHIKTMPQGAMCLQIGPNGKIYTLVVFGINGIGMIPQLASIDKPNLEGSKSDYKVVIQDSNLVSYNLPYVYQPYYKLYYTTNLETNPCADTAYFDVHVDDFFRAFKVYYGDGDSLVLKPPFQKAYRLRHVYKNTGTYYFKAMGLNPNCDYYTTVGDSVSVARQPRRIASNTLLKPACDSAVLHLNDSFFNAQKVVYSYPVYPNDTLMLSDSFNQSKIRKLYSRQDSVLLLTINTQLSNSACPFPSEYNDTLPMAFLPPHNLRFSLSGALVDSASGKISISGCAPLKIGFSDSSQDLRSGILFWGSDTVRYANATLAQKTFSTGSYTAVMQDTNTFGCNASDTFHITAFTRPAASWSSGPLKQCLKGNSLVLGALINGSDASMLFWGDGDSSLADSGILLTHTYKEAGRYKPRLISNTENNCINIIDTSLELYAAVRAGFSTNASVQCFKGHAFVFSRADTAAALNQWQWGDSSTDSISFERSIVKQYADYGNFYVRNITRTANNCSDTSTSLVSVLESPHAVFSIADTLQCISGNEFEIKTLSTCSNPDSLKQMLQWGDAAALPLSGNTILKHSYNKAGRYKIQLISNKGSCADSAHKWVSAKAIPILKLNLSGFCLGDSTFLKVRSSTPGMVYRWQVNMQDIVLNDSSYVCLFKATGIYPVKVSAANSVCSAYDSVSAEIINKPIAAFLPVHFNEQSDAVKFKFINQSLNASAYLWHFGHMDSSSLESPEFVFQDTGYAKVRLIASNQNTCFDTAIQIIPVYRQFEFYLPNAVTPNANGLNDGFGLNTQQIAFVNSFNMQVFNRWGEMVFQSSDPSVLWMPEKLQQGIYIYRIDVRDVYNVLHELKGVVEVLK